MSELITKEYNGLTFTFRADGYFNMTKAARAFGKDIKEFWLNQRTQVYINALGKTLGLSPEFLKQTQMGRNGGTWAHPKLAVFFAQWLSIEFEV